MNVPRHIAIIMDGNGRWAMTRGLARYHGHQVGVESARAVIRQAGQLGVEVLTLFTLSCDNLGRSGEELDFIIALLDRYLVKERLELRKENVCFRTIGSLTELPERTQRLLAETSDFLRSGNGLILNIALNYLGRNELRDACRNIAGQAVSGEINVEDISTEMIAEHLQTTGLPDPDLLIRTSGEQRISNFLLWQLAYTEFYFADEMWPDFREEAFTRAVVDYGKRERRYGLEGNKGAVKCLNYHQL